jgi:hypothetical protein
MFVLTAICANWLDKACMAQRRNTTAEYQFYQRCFATRHLLEQADLPTTAKLTVCMNCCCCGASTAVAKPSADAAKQSNLMQP